MTKQILKNAWARFLPLAMLALDFATVVAVALVVLWLVVVMPVTALAQDGQHHSPSTTPTPQIMLASAVPFAGKFEPVRLADWRMDRSPKVRTEPR